MGLHKKQHMGGDSTLSRAHLPGDAFLPVDLPLLLGSDDGVLLILLLKHLKVVLQLLLVQQIDSFHMLELHLQVLVFQNNTKTSCAMSKGHTEAWILVILTSKPHLPMPSSPADMDCSRVSDGDAGCP